MGQFSYGLNSQGMEFFLVARPRKTTLKQEGATVFQDLFGKQGVGGVGFLEARGHFSRSRLEEIPMLMVNPSSLNTFSRIRSATATGVPNNDWLLDMSIRLHRWSIVPLGG